MHAAAIAVVGFIVRIARSEVERAADLFVEQRVEHRMQNAIVGAKRPFSDVPRSFVRIEYLIEAFRSVATRRIDNLSLLQFKSNAIKDGPLIARRRIELNRAVHAVLDRRGEAFAVGDIAFSGTRDDRNVFD